MSEKSCTCPKCGYEARNQYILDNIHAVKWCPYRRRTRSVSPHIFPCPKGDFVAHSARELAVHRETNCWNLEKRNKSVSPPRQKSNRHKRPASRPLSPMVDLDSNDDDDDDGDKQVSTTTTTGSSSGGSSKKSTAPSTAHYTEDDDIDNTKIVMCTGCAVRFHKRARMVKTTGVKRYNSVVLDLCDACVKANGMIHLSLEPLEK